MPRGPRRRDPVCVATRTSLDGQLVPEISERVGVDPAAGVALRVRSALRPSGRGLVIALIPAHNEERKIGDAVRSLHQQESPPDLIVVCADNCTDSTVDEAEAAGAQVLATIGNVHKKAGALNQALDVLLPELRDEDAVLVMDADSILAPSFLSEARRHLRDGVGGVGGVFTGRGGGGYVGMLQRNEYARYARDVARLKGKVLVLTGTATLFSVRTLRHVVWARAEGLLPGNSAQVYDTNVLTEDNELTLALRHLGYEVISPKGCRLTTEVMESWRDLYRQRLRWKRGALENLRDYGLMDGTIHLQPIWLAVTGIFVLERVVTVWARGPLQMALAATLLVEMTFDLFLQAVHAKAIWDTLLNNERRW
jgi:cellulose synthase/poly-beta-1,6-N-acetylglucosamine synthase-like glycosyltransferase